MPQAIAQLIGIYALQFIIVLLILTLVLIFLLWRLFEACYPKLWEMINALEVKIRDYAIITLLWQRFPKFWSFLGRRLSPSGYLGLHLTIGLILGLIAFSIFGNLALDVLQEKTLVQFDTTLAANLYANSSSAEVIFFSTITSLGGIIATVMWGSGVAIALFIYRQRLLFMGWVVAILGNSLLNAALKFVFHRGRPEFDEPILIETNYSFPSGHAMGAVVLYGMLAYLLLVLFNRTPNPVYLTCLVVTLVILIGFSRLYLGVHYFSDVIAGYLAGIGWLSIVISGTEIARRRQIYKKLRQETSAT